MSRPKHVLITGVNGFAGFYTAQLLSEKGYSVHGLGQEETPAEELSQFLESYQRCDLTDQAQVQALAWPTFDRVVHLAGLADVGASYSQPSRYMQVHSDITINILETLVSKELNPRCLFISSSTVYGSGSSTPIDESTPFSVKSPYAASKLAVENLAAYYRTRGLDIVVTRPFNHFGPRQRQGFILADFASQVAQAEQTGGGEIVVGNLHSGRDYTDVRDIAQAYEKLILHDDLPHYIYNVCSGVGRSGQEIIDLLIKHSRTPDAITVKTSAQKMRPNDDDIIIGSSQRLQEDTGWTPQIPFEQTIVDTLTYWREHLSS